MMKLYKRTETYITIEFTEKQAGLLELITRNVIVQPEINCTEGCELEEVWNLRKEIHKALTDQGVKG